MGVFGRGETSSICYEGNRPRCESRGASYDKIGNEINLPSPMLLPVWRPCGSTLVVVGRVLTGGVPETLRALTRCLPKSIMALAENRNMPDFTAAPDTIRTCDLCLRRARPQAPAVTTSQQQSDRSESAANPLCSSSVHAPICTSTGLFALISRENWCLGLP